MHPSGGRGVATGVDIGIYTPKISPSKLLWGKNNVRTAIQQFYTPRKTFTPKTNFWLRPCRVDRNSALIFHHL